MICPHCKKPIKTGPTEAQKARILELRAGGYSYRDIDKITGVPYSTVYRVVKDHGVCENAVEFFANQARKAASNKDSKLSKSQIRRLERTDKTDV